MAGGIVVGDRVKFARDGNKGRVIKAMGDGYFVVYLPPRATLVAHERELSVVQPIDGD